jgi:hypothetical protein
MDNPISLRILIRNAIINGASREECYNKLVNNFGDYNLPALNINEWFEQMDKDTAPPKKQSYCTPQLHNLLETIHSEYRRAERGLDGRKCPNNNSYNCSLTLISGRYAVDAKYNSREFKSFILLDTIHGQQRFFFVQIFTGLLSPHELVYCTRKCVRSVKSSSEHQKNAFFLCFCLAEWEFLCLSFKTLLRIELKSSFLVVEGVYIGEILG